MAQGQPTWLGSLDWLLLKPRTAPSSPSPSFTAARGVIIGAAFVDTGGVESCPTARSSPFHLRGAIASLRCPWRRSEEHTSELQSLMRISYAVFCLKKKIKIN